MKERPILFSAPMVRAIFEGRKTMTRRVIRDFPTTGYRWGGFIIEGARGDEGKATVVPEGNMPYMAQGQIKARCPYGHPGDRLWVRETFQTLEDFAVRGATYYRADGENVTAIVEGKEYDLSHKWRPSIFMPRTLSRILLEVTAVRVERVQDISEEDAKAEGVTLIEGNPLRHDGLDYSSEFTGLWDSLNAKRGYGWDANPWVWVIEFKKVSN